MCVVMTFNIIDREKGKKDPKINKIEFSGSISTLHSHISRFPNHYQVYKQYCVNQGIPENPRAIPSNILKANEEEELKSVL